jgi:hypothetical protein
MPSSLLHQISELSTVEIFCLVGIYDLRALRAKCGNHFNLKANTFRSEW